MSLKYVASYLLAVTAGNENPSKKDLKTILSAVGAEVDDAALDGLLAAVKGKTIHEVWQFSHCLIINIQVINSGLGKLQTIPAGGVVAVSSVATTAAVSKDAEPQPVEEEEEDDMGFSLFD